MGMFAEAAKSDTNNTFKVIERVYDKPGVYIQRIDKQELEEFRDSGGRMYLKLSKTNLWVEDDNGGLGHQQWSEPCDFTAENERGGMTERKRYFFRDCAKIVSQITGEPISKVTPEALDKVMEEKLLEGLYVRTQVTARPKSNGTGTWNQVTYSPLSVDQVKEILDAKSRKRAGLK